MAAVQEETERLSPEKDDREEEEVEVDLEKCAEDFAQYLCVDSSSEIRGLENTIEDMLAKLDEFSHLADTIRNDSTQAIFEVIPDLHARSLELQPMFDKIDNLEAFVDVVHQNVEEMEEHVNKAEKALGGRSIKRVINSLPAFMQKKGQGSVSPRQQTQWEPPHIFHTEDFFGKVQEFENTELLSEDR